MGVIPTRDKRGEGAARRSEWAHGPKAVRHRLISHISDVIIARACLVVSNNSSLSIVSIVVIRSWPGFDKDRYGVCGCRLECLWRYVLLGFLVLLGDVCGFFCF